jgi:hypothetical protein
VRCGEMGACEPVLMRICYLLLVLLLLTFVGC